ncbi:MAG: extracellular solute-binding protein [Phycisphaerales bacterium]|nr:extracellular solute-binding protein [Phycisphaerales bacterium]
MRVLDLGTSAIICTILLATLLLHGCDRASSDPRPVVVYVSADEAIARPILQQFEAATGIEVLPVFDTEVTKTTGLVTRLRSERERPRADLFWSSECFRMIELDQDGMLAPLTGAPFDDWMSGRAGLWRSDAGTWHAFAPRARVLVHRVEEAGERETPLPGTWFELADPRWKGRIAMADPRFGTTSGHLGAMKAYWIRDGRPERFDDWVDGLAGNEVAILTTGNAGVVEAVAAGRYDIGMTDTDDVWAARERGFDVALIYPRHASADRVGGGTLLIPNTVARIVGGPNPEGAHALARWLLSEEVEDLLARSSSHNIRLRSDGTDPYDVPDVLDVDLVEASAQMPEAIRRLRGAVRTGGEE